MVDQPLSIDFVYTDVDASDMFESHKNAINKNDEVHLELRIINSPSYDTIYISPYDVIDDKWRFDDIDAFNYESSSTSFDLTRSSLISYVTKNHDRLIEYWDINDVSADDALSELLTLVRLGYEGVPRKPVAVFSQTPDSAFNNRAIGGPPVTAESLAHDSLTYLPWLTVFTPAMVETYGRDTLLSAPAWHVEELDDGAILVVCHDDLDWETSNESVADHIGLPAYTALY